MKKSILFFYLFFFGSFIFAQQPTDSLSIAKKESLIQKNLNEVVIIGNPNENYFNEQKVLGSIDSYLDESNSINMIRRGAYAWEPMLNGMATERSVITIDGMRIFHACTDKMDPITSYVENTNLSGANIEDGQSGSENGGTIAGSIDLIRKKSGFKQTPKLGGNVFAGYESNNKQNIYGAALNYSGKRFYSDIDFTYRNASNYKAGKKAGKSEEVDYSQFTKYNISAITGYKISRRQEIEASVIYDRATNVGYPGLPMDVSLAEAIIASLQHRYLNISKHIDLWETKIYLNTIKHIMDDSNRPDVPIRMDMPGWSNTQGFYTKLMGAYNKHEFKATFSGYRNNSLAEMTMYPNDPEEIEMYMLTWPDVNTLYGGIHFEDKIAFTRQLELAFSTGLGVQHNKIKSEIGLNSLQLFYPHLKSEKTRIIKNISAQVSYQHKNFVHKIGVGYGDRAPSISESYGFYLLNANDNYDYIGNPNLKNEKSINVDFSSTYNTQKLSAKIKGNYFYILDYIIGTPRPGMPPMNITSDGIRIYEQLNHASIFNASLLLDYKPFSDWKFSLDASYRYGQGAENKILPLIQPLNYRLSIRYEKKTYFAEVSVAGSTKNRNSSEFGETQKPAYAVANIALSKIFLMGGKRFTLKLGVENLFNQYYVTFSDWIGIPRMGRNIYTNMIFKF